MKVLYIAGNQPRCGKTALAITLARHLAGKGKSVTLFKPIALIPHKGYPYADEDAPFYPQSLPSQPLASRDWPLAITPEELSANADTITRKVKEEANRLLQGSDTLVVEGLNGLDPASQVAQISARLAQALEAQVIPIVLHQPDMAPQELLKTKELFGERLLGMVINGVLPFRNHWLHHQAVPYIESHGIPVLGIVPEDRTLMALRVRDIAEHLHGEIAYYPERANELVEHFMAGGLTMDWGTHVFSRRDRKGVIVRSNRPDIQMAALSTDPVCLVLTGGGRPIEYVEYELKEREVPAILVGQDTLTAMRELDTIPGKATIHHTQKIERFSELLGQRFNPSALLPS